MPVFFDSMLAVSVTPGAGWVVKDLSGAPWNLPSNAVGIIGLIVNTHASTNYLCGYRKYGSADNYTDYVYADSLVPFYCGVDVDRKIGLNITSGGTTVTFYVIGYFTDEEAVFFTNWYSKTPTVTGFSTVDCSAQIPADSVGAFFNFCNGTTVAYAGLRKMGASDVLVHYIVGHNGAIAGIDGDRKCEAYSGNTSTVKLYLVGYLKSGTIKLNGLNVSIGSTDVFVPIDLSLDAPPTATGVILHHKPTTGTAYYVAQRAVGSSDDKYYKNRYHSWYCSALGAGKTVEVKVSHLNLDTYVVGYFLPTITPSPPLLTGLSPGVGETGVAVDEPISFTLSAQGGDGVDINSVTVQIKSDIFQDGDGEFSFEGDVNSYTITVTHPDFGLEESVNVIINASSLLEEPMEELDYNFTTAMIPRAPLLVSFNPRPGQTLVDINLPVGFGVMAVGGDGVDIDSVTVQIGAETYQNGDPEFSYTGTSSEYAIMVAHADWGLEEAVAIKINASSMLGAPAVEKSYGLLTKWDPSLTRKGRGRIELFEL